MLTRGVKNVAGRDRPDAEDERNKPSDGDDFEGSIHFLNSRLQMGK